jgi:hypothetical protein
MMKEMTRSRKVTSAVKAPRARFWSSVTSRFSQIRSLGSAARPTRRGYTLPCGWGVRGWGGGGLDGPVGWLGAVHKEWRWRAGPKAAPKCRPEASSASIHNHCNMKANIF